MNYSSTYGNVRETFDKVVKLDRWFAAANPERDGQWLESVASIGEVSRQLRRFLDTASFAQKLDESAIKEEFKWIERSVSGICVAGTGGDSWKRIDWAKYIVGEVLKRSLALVKQIRSSTSSVSKLLGAVPMNVPSDMEIIAKTISERFNSTFKDVQDAVYGCVMDNMAAIFPEDQALEILNQQGQSGLDTFGQCCSTIIGEIEKFPESVKFAHEVEDTVLDVTSFSEAMCLKILNESQTMARAILGEMGDSLIGEIFGHFALKQGKEAPTGIVWGELNGRELALQLATKVAVLSDLVSSCAESVLKKFNGAVFGLADETFKGISDFSDIVVSSLVRIRQCADESSQEIGERLSNRVGRLLRAPVKSGGISAKDLAAFLGVDGEKRSQLVALMEEKVNGIQSEVSKAFNAQNAELAKFTSNSIARLVDSHLPGIMDLATDALPEFKSISSTCRDLTRLCDNSNWGEIWNNIKEKLHYAELIQDARNLKENNERMFSRDISLPPQDIDINIHELGQNGGAQANEYDSSIKPPMDSTINQHVLESTGDKIPGWDPNIDDHPLDSTPSAPPTNSTINVHPLDSTKPFPSTDSTIEIHSLPPTGPLPSDDSTIEIHSLPPTPSAPSWDSEISVNPLDPTPSSFPSTDSTINVNPLDSTKPPPSTDSTINEHPLDPTPVPPSWISEIHESTLDSTALPDSTYPIKPPDSTDSTKPDEGGGELPPTVIPDSTNNHGNQGGNGEGGPEDDPNINENPLPPTPPDPPPWDPNIPVNPLPDTPEPPPDDQNIPIHPLPPTPEPPPWDSDIPIHPLPSTDIPSWDSDIPIHILSSTKFPPWDSNIPIHSLPSTVIPPISEWQESNTYFESPESDAIKLIDIEVPAKTRIKKSRKKGLGWRGWDPEWTKGLLFLIHDGDQQIFNPYGHPDALWTIFSFRPMDRDQLWPQISIIPSSFQVIDSIDHMLDNIPYVVIKEYFFRNRAGDVVNFLTDMWEWFSNQKSKEDGKGKKEQWSWNSFSAKVKEYGKTLLDTVREYFRSFSNKELVIDIPYYLYIGLRNKVYGNTYVFPYIVDQSVVINYANNTSEWGVAGSGGIIQALKEGLNSVTEFLGGMGLGLIGSQAQVANLFPAPSWSNKNSNPIEFSFDLILINDNIVNARNNYMCVNTIIHNNRSMQKAMLAFPGALYELWLPTGQRHLMCAAEFKLYPLGLNRLTPEGFFAPKMNQGAFAGANFEIGVKSGYLDASEGKANDASKGGILQNPHLDGVEVIPDAYKLSMRFVSCLANNLNTSVFQYYVKMTPYDNYRSDAEVQKRLADEAGLKKNVFDSVTDPAYNAYIKKYGEKVSLAHDAYGSTRLEKLSQTWVASNNKVRVAAGYKVEQPKVVEVNEGGGAATPAPAPQNEGKFKNVLESRANSILFDEYMEKFDESTYNKKLQEIKTAMGDTSIAADSAVLTIIGAQKTIRESEKFLQKMYNAEKNNLWYKPFELEEIYTTINPDYRLMLRKKYQQQIQEISNVDDLIQETQHAVNTIMAELRKVSVPEERNALLNKKVKTTRKLNKLKKRRDSIADELIKIDVNLIQASFDDHDVLVSVRKNNITKRIFQQVWNEKIMNPYEREKLQYLTSTEKTRYFNEKVRDIKKFDPYGILNRKDWFFRVAVLDFIVAELQKLVVWFKDCYYDEFETVYRIVRKIRLLLLDVNSIRNDEVFDINKTNLFSVSDNDMREFTKLDGMLIGNTLYELFQTQISLNEDENGDEEDSIEVPVPDMKEVVKDRKSELDGDQQRKVRQDIVARYWGNEDNLTKAAYASINDMKDDGPVNVDLGAGEVQIFEGGLKQLKDEIITLKLSGSDSDRLRKLLGAFTNLINIVKEGMVVEKMNEMRLAAQKEMNKESQSVNAKTFS